MSQTEKRLKLNGREIILIGTAHISQESIDQVKETIINEKPDNVAIELDEGRLSAMKNPDAWKQLDIVKVLKQGKGFVMMANLVLASFQRRMGSDVGVKPGEEMKAAIEVCEQNGIKTSMVDRPIQTTLRRAWAKSSFWGKMKLLSVLISSAFSKEEISSEEIESLKKSNEMDTMMNELADYLPAVKKVLIDERDQYLASHIWESEGNKIVAVLGAGHLPGVEAHLNELSCGNESSDTSEISIIPKKSIAGKILGWAIPAIIIILIGLGFYFGGRDKGSQMALSWIIWNGGLAALGALIAGGHPLTILVSLVSAPITSLCPFIGVGIVAGIVQASIVKPKVQDMEALYNDASSLKGFYKNRILRVLLVFILSSVGSSVATFVSGIDIVAKFASLFHKAKPASLPPLE
ncbi:MAG: TraB/GumN family protein [Treponemataceae bacterium]|nr:TraB/GumN family protein [Treponemataceae bacterium]